MITISVVNFGAICGLLGWALGMLTAGVFVLIKSTEV